MASPHVLRSACLVSARAHLVLSARSGNSGYVKAVDTTHVHVWIGYGTFLSARGGIHDTSEVTTDANADATMWGSPQLCTLIIHWSIRRPFSTCSQEKNTNLNVLNFSGVLCFVLPFHHIYTI